MAENTFEYDVTVNARQGISELAKFSKAQEQTVKRIKAAQEEQVRSNVKVDRALIESRAEYAKKRAELVRYSKNLKKNQAEADRTAKELLELADAVEKNKQALREGRRSLVEYGKQLDKLQRQASKGIDFGRSPNVIPAPPRLLGPGLPSAEGRKAAFGRGAKNFAAKQSARFNAVSAAAGSSGLLAPLASGAFVQQTISASVDLTQQRKKLELLSSKYGEYDQVLKIVASSADTFNKSQREATTEFGNVFARLRPLGVSLEDIKGVYEGFNTVAVASGASSEATRIAFMQLSQAIGSGRLAGDEFRSVSEQIPGVLIPIAREMGVTVGELKKLGSEGMITSEVLIKALSGSLGMTTEEIKKFIAQQPAGKFKAFSNAVSDLSVVIGDALMPIALTLVETLTELIKIFLRLPKLFQNVSGLAIGLGAALVIADLGAKALNLSLKGLIAKFALVAGKAALFIAPLVALGLILEETAEKKRSFDEAMSGEDTDLMKDKIVELMLQTKQLKVQMEATKKSAFYRGQAGEINNFKRQIEELEKQIDELTKRRQLVIEIVTKTHTIGGIDYKMDGPGGRLVPIDPPETVSDRIERERKEAAQKKDTEDKEAAKRARLAAQLARAEANSALRLSQKRAKAVLKIARDEYALRAELERSNHEVQESNLIGIARETQAILNAQTAGFRALHQREQQLEDAVTNAEQRLEAAMVRAAHATPGVDAINAQGVVAGARVDVDTARQNLGNFQSAAPSMLGNVQAATSSRLTESFRQQTHETMLQVESLRKRNELLAQGASPEIIQGELMKLDISRREADELRQLNGQQNVSADTIARIKQEAQNARDAIDQLTVAQQNGSHAIRDYINTSMEFVTDIQARIVDIASTIEQSISTAIQGVVDGTLTATQAFQQFFASVGQAFMKMAADMIAKLIIINLLKSALNLFGGSFSGGANIGQQVDMPSSVGIGAGNGIIQNAGNQGFGTFGPNFGIRQFAKGGIVTGPTTALIGEGGMNEAVVPLPNGKAIPVDMRGAAGGNVTSNVTVNVDGSGSSMDSDPDGPAKLGRAIDTAVRKVIMDERRSGGLLYSGR